MRSLPAARAIVCPGCGKLTPAGDRGPLPTRCRDCRRRPVLPARAAGVTSCSRCGAELAVLGRRGRLPSVCRPCRREAVNAQRRTYPVTDRRYTPEELAAFVVELARRK